MKKTFFAVILALLFFAGPLMSQKQLYFGVAGTGLSSVIINQNNYGYTALDEKFTMGAAGNVNIGFDFSNHVGLKLEIGIAKLGENYDKEITKNDTLFNFTRDVKLNYLQIPLLFKFRTGGDVAKFYLMAGPQFNFLLSASQKYLKNEVVESGTFPGPGNIPVVLGEETITDWYNSFDVMGRLDLGVDIQLAKFLSLNVGLTMDYGFMDINAKGYDIPDTDGNYNPSHNVYGGINFGINYLLPLGSK